MVLDQASSLEREVFEEKDDGDPVRSSRAAVPPPAFSYEDYTVGWVCALPKEQTAAIAMLDIVHPSLPNRLNDHNSYTLGRVGQHNIVIACLPKGQYATIPAAKVATWMLTTYPSIRFGLMVGIGGGVPSKVKLGDIVVSTPIAGYPGVVQWDMGKTENGGQFRRTGSLNNPPTALLTALTKLETNHALHEPKFLDHLKVMGKRYPRLQSRYTIPPLFADPSREADQSRELWPYWQSILVMTWTTILNITFHLLGSFAFWSAEQQNGVAKGVKVSTGTDQIQKASDEPRIHYGLIASGNQVVKDANTRDRLDASLDGHMLCIEMEAAGLMNDFPCLVIRGICDYADSRKAKNWQEYAAGMAAAYAKELLEVADLEAVKHTPEARIIMQTLESIAAKTEVIALKQEQQIQVQEQQNATTMRRNLYKWLSTLTPSARHQESRRQRALNTGLWLLEHPHFRAWTSPNSQHRVLCCYGHPGAGKTILTSLAIDELSRSMSDKSTIGLAYVYCDYRDQKAQTAENILGTIIKQLLECLLVVPLAVLQLYSGAQQRNSGPSLEDVQKLLEAVASKFEQIYICLDAVDELHRPQGIMRLLKDRPPNIHILLTGRPHVQDVVEKHLQDVLTITVEAHDFDIMQFIKREIGGPDDIEPDAMNETLYEKVLTRIVASAKGVFLLPALQIRAVLQNLTIREREAALEALPSNLGEAFAGSFVRIQQQSAAHASRAARIFAWVHLSWRPLTLDELLCSLSIQEGDKTFNPKGIPVRKTLLNCCHGLVTLDQETFTLRLAHFSIEEYLRGEDEIFGISKIEWHAEIATTCLTFISLNPSNVLVEGYEQFVQSALTQFASLEWGHHVRRHAGQSKKMLEVVKEYFREGWRRNPTYLQLLYSRMYKRYNDNPLSNQFPGFTYTKYNQSIHDIQPGHISAFFGLLEVILYLDSTDMDLDTKDYIGRTPLYWAAQEGRTKIVQHLLNKPKVDVNTQDDRGETALSAAIWNGHRETVQVLLTRPDINVNSQTYRHRQTPLVLAAERCDHEIVQQLLATGRIDINRQDAEGNSVLFAAIHHGHDKIVQKVLARPEVDPSMMDEEELGALVFASTRGHHGMIQQILARPELDINARDRDGSTALFIAIMRFCDDSSIVEQILAKEEVDINIADNRGMTALMQASRMGLKSVVRLLLARPEVFINLQCQKGKTALMYTISNGHIKVAEELLTRSEIDVNLKDDEGRTALFYAVEKGDADMLGEVLAWPDVDIDLQDNSGSTALMCAYREGRKEVVELLLALGATDVDFEDKSQCQADMSAGDTLGHDNFSQLESREAETDSDMKTAKSSFVGEREATMGEWSKFFADHGVDIREIAEHI